jgi:hypothetical protein
VLLLGVIGGLLGAYFTYLNEGLADLRKRGKCGLTTKNTAVVVVVTVTRLLSSLACALASKFQKIPDCISPERLLKRSSATHACTCAGAYIMSVCQARERAGLY